jgi:dolichol-phosphate mannosyltransferase
MNQESIISIILPAYNEDKNLEILIPKIYHAVKNRVFLSHEIIVVNDGSIDNTELVLINLIKEIKTLRVINLKKRMGQSFAVWEGVKRAEGDLILTKDADFQTDPEEIPMMIENLKEFDMVCGYRKNRNDSYSKRISSIIANRVRRIVLRGNIIDSACGFKVFKKKCINNMEFFDGMHRFMPDLFLIHNFKVRQVEVRHYPRVHGETKYNIKNRLGKALKDLIMVKKIKNKKNNL